jgi:hypothetical protein
VARFVLTRKVLIGCILTAALVAAPAALAVTTANSGVVASTAGAGVVSRGSVTGTVSTVNGWSLTVQTPGRRIGVVAALIGTADRILGQNTPYVYGGGHTSAGNASIGIPGPGYNGRRIGFDCSGAVGAVLAGAGLWQPGTGVPNDAGIIAQLRQERVIAPGVGSGPVEVTLWDHPGVHIFMNIDGRFFGTSDGGEGGDANGGAGWLYDGAPDASNPAFKPYHFLPRVLNSSTGSGQSFGFALPTAQSRLAGLVAGEKVKVRYKQLASGTMIATAITFQHPRRASGTVALIARNGHAFTLQTPSGRSMTLSTDTQLLDGVLLGDTVRVGYSKVGSELIAHWVNVTANTPVNTGSGGSPQTPSGGSPQTPSGGSPQTPSGGSPQGPGAS